VYETWQASPEDLKTRIYEVTPNIPEQVMQQIMSSHNVENSTSNMTDDVFKEQKQ
jgi:hypothetical protein